MSDDVLLVPAKSVPRRIRPVYMILMVLFSVATGGAAAGVAVLKVYEASSKASLARKHDDAADALLKAQLKEAEARAATAEKSVVELDQLAKSLKREHDRAMKQSEAIRDESSRVNKSLLAQIDDLKEYGRRLKGVIDDRLMAQGPTLPPQPADGVLRARGLAVVRRVIGPGVMTRSNGGGDAAEKYNKFEVGETVTVAAVTASGVQIENATGERSGWLTSAEASQYLQTLQEPK